MFFRPYHFDAYSPHTGPIFLWFSKEIARGSSVAAVQSCFCFIIVAAAIVLGIGALFLLFVLLYSQRVASQSCEMWRAATSRSRGRSGHMIISIMDCTGYWVWTQV